MDLQLLPLLSEDARWLLAHQISIHVVVQSRSMEPSIPMGTKVQIEPLGTRPRVGDVVLIQSSNGLLLHRVVCVFRDIDTWYIFHAGETASYGVICSQDNILGRAVQNLESDVVDFSLWPNLSVHAQRRMYALQRKCLRYAWYRSMVHAIGLPRVKAFKTILQIVKPYFYNFLST